MDVLKRILALLICTLMICGCLISCVNPGPDSNPDDNSGNSNQGGQNQLPETEKYVATYRILYATHDDNMKAAVDSLNASGSVLTVNGDDLKIVTNTTLDDISSSEEYTYVGGVLYHASTIKVGSESVSYFKKAAMSADELSNLVSKAGAGASIGIDDFSSQVKNTPGNTIEYSCEGISDEAKESLRKTFAARFEGQGATVEIDNVFYELEMRDDKNQSSILSCSFIITMDGTDYEITMLLYCDYDYEAEVNISAPQNADAYTEVLVDKIIG